MYQAKRVNLLYVSYVKVNQFLIQFPYPNSYILHNQHYVLYLEVNIISEKLLCCNIHILLLHSIFSINNQEFSILCLLLDESSGLCHNHINPIQSYLICVIAIVLLLTNENATYCNAAHYKFNCVIFEKYFDICTLLVYYGR